MIDPKDRWQTVTPRIPADADPAAPRYEGGIDFTLTQAERSRAASASVHLERGRREQNRADEQRANRKGGAE